MVVCLRVSQISHNHTLTSSLSIRRCVDVTEPAGGGGGGGGGRGLWVGGGGGVGGEAEVSPLLQEAAMRKMVSSLRGASYRPTLPPEIATDAAIYVAVSDKEGRGSDAGGVGEG